MIGYGRKRRRVFVTMGPGGRRAVPIEGCMPLLDSWLLVTWKCCRQENRTHEPVYGLQCQQFVVVVHECSRAALRVGFVCFHLWLVTLNRPGYVQYHPAAVFCPAPAMLCRTNIQTACYLHYSSYLLYSRIIMCNCFCQVYYPHAVTEVLYTESANGYTL